MSEARAENSGIISLLDNWQFLSHEEKLPTFRNLPQDDAEDLFLSLNARDQALLLEAFGRGERRMWIRFLAPDDAADLLQEVSEERKNELISMVDEAVRRDIVALLNYREDEAGGLMSPRFARVRPDMLIAEATRYVQRQAISTNDQLHYVYILDSNQVLLGVMSLRELFVSQPDKKVADIMQSAPVSVPEDLDQEAISQIFKQHRFVALPVVDDQGRMKGIVTLDDILDVSQEEATEDIQKLGGTEAFEAPYPQMSIISMIRKRGGWLSVLFVGELFTAFVMAHFETELASAVVLALFLPLIISSGGNSGSQATSIVIRSLALKELRLRDWWWVFLRECITGLALGAILACIGFARIMIWPTRVTDYGPHFFVIACTVAGSLVGVVLFGSIIGSMLPFILKKFKFDPAAASAPLVATLVDVMGLIIYFQLAKIILTGTLL